MFERDDYVSWDEYFMAIAKLSSIRSKDPVTQVGACIVDNNNRILSIGYNGTPNGYEDIDFPWNKEGDELNIKRLYVCHAEMNAISNYFGDKSRLIGSKIYVTSFPCNECAKLIIQNGIKEVIYESIIDNSKNKYIASKILFDKCGIKYRSFIIDRDIEIKSNNEGIKLIRRKYDK